MFDDLYPDDAQRALQAKIARPLEPMQSTQRFSLWGLGAALPKGIAAGAAQGIGSTADLLGAFGSVLATTEASGGGMFSVPNEKEQKQNAEATTRLRESGPDYMSDGGRSFRNVAKDYTPDPLTAHTAERMVFDVARMGSKAIVAGVALGNVPGAVVAGAEEGFTQSDELAQQGVDLATRTKVGAVTAATTALSFALPVAGKTLAQTAGLAAVGGPVSYIAQNYGAREILKNADYSKLADQYDPFDPMGIGVATAASFLFGGAAMALRVKPKAKGEAPPEGAPVRPDQPTEPIAPAVAEEVVDAARVSLLRSSIDSTNPLPDDLATAPIHAEAHSTALDQMATGERVIVQTPENMALQATKDMSAAIEPLRLAGLRTEPAQTMIPSLPVVEAVVDTLRLSSDVPQFKGGADAAGVVEPLGGSFDRTGVAPIQIWERLNGTQEVISGRHRLDLAKRSGETTIPAQVHREADGFTAIRAAALDAELNIRDGQGKVRDYVQYFEGNQFTRQQAEARGLLARATGQRAFAIANDGGDQLIASHRNGLLGDDAAVAIARTAPKDNRLQSVGLKAVQDGKTISTATNLMQAVKSMSDGRADTTGDMFGFDDSAMREATAMAMAVSKIQRELSENLAAVQGASKRPELAKKNGVNIKDPQGLQKRISEIQAERAQWDNWSTNPELVSRVRRELGQSEIVPAVERADVDRPAPTSIVEATDSVDARPSLFDDVADPLTARMSQAEANNPALMDIEIPTAFDADGVVTAKTTAREYLAEVQRQADAEIEESRLLEVAANCFLEF